MARSLPEEVSMHQFKITGSVENSRETTAGNEPEALQPVALHPQGIYVHAHLSTRVATEQ